MASTTSIPTETATRCDASKLKIGDVFSRHSFGKIKEIVKQRNPVTYREEILFTVENSNGNSWNIGFDIVELEFSFAEQFEDEEKVSRTRMIEIMLEHPRTAMTLNYNKKPKVDDVAKALTAGKTGTAKDWKALVKEQLEGAERTMIGYHAMSFDEHRRLRFQDAGTGQRLVDPRTLNWMIVNRIKYTIGK